MVLGDFVNCIIEANHSAQKLLEIISENFSYFRDESIYNNKTGKKIFDHNFYVLTRLFISINIFLICISHIISYEHLILF